MRLYHGSNTDIKEINLAMCRPYWTGLLPYCYERTSREDGKESGKDLWGLTGSQ